MCQTILLTMQEAFKIFSDALKERGDMAAKNGDDRLAHALYSVAITALITVDRLESKSKQDEQSSDSSS